MGEIRHFGGRGLVVLATAALTALALVGLALASFFPTEDPNERLLLRLHDLPAGYIPLDDGEVEAETEFFCDGIHPKDASHRLNGYLRRFDPAGCLGVYLRVYEVPGAAPTPSVAGTGALRAKTVAGAAAGFAVAGELLGKLVEKKQNLEEIAPQTTVGEATRLFHFHHIPKTGLTDDRRGSFLVWRSGRVVSVTFAAAASFADSDRIALELAQRQQVHVENPTAYSEAERDDSEVTLDNPAATFPVWWLGHDFAPGNRLPEAELLEGFVEPLPGTIPYRQQLLLRYDQGIEIEGWTKAGWKHFHTSPEGRYLTTGACEDPVAVALAEGRAKIFTAPVVGYASCGRAPKRYYAIVHVGGTVIAVNLTGCPDCVPHTTYNSLKGMKAIVRGLELRPKPAY